MSTAYRYWRNKVQRSIRAAKYQYYSVKVTDVQRVNSTKWWREIKKTLWAKFKTGMAPSVFRK
jgi:hypothetical protein